MAWDFKARPELWNGMAMEMYYADSPHPQIFHDFEGKVTRVHDGDTFTIKTDFRDFEFPVRMIGIDSLEMNAGGQVAQKWLESQILGKTIDVIVDPKERVGKWGRILGVVFAGGMNINELSIIEGMSVPFDQRNELANRAADKASEAIF
jgi:endonuclease YncB( thermonuclease family)